MHKKNSKLGFVGQVVTEQLESVTTVRLHLTQSLAYELGIKRIIECRNFRVLLTRISLKKLGFSDCPNPFHIIQTQFNSLFSPKVDICYTFQID
jgi:hypothetical protein